MIKRFALLILLGIVLGLSTYPTRSVSASDTTFKNPIGADHGSDPWMLYYNGMYYLTTTSWSVTSEPGITIKKATSIKGLIDAPPVSVWSDTTPDRCCNIWAPEFHLLSGPNGMHWYIYYVAGGAKCCDGQRIWVLESSGTDPMGPYTFKGHLTDEIGGWMIDPTVFQFHGALYLIFSAFQGSYQNLYIAPMSNPWTISDDRVAISVSTFKWEESGNPVNEGPEILEHDGKVFLIYSASSCATPDYKLGMLTLIGKDPLRLMSWRKSPDPVFQRNDANGVFGPGHNGFFKSPDGTEDWIVYHANTSAGGGCDVYRTTRIQKFTWNADGTPNFGTPLPLGTDISLPAGDPGQ